MYVIPQFIFKSYYYTNPAAIYTIYKTRNIGRQFRRTFRKQ